MKDQLKIISLIIAFVFLSSGCAINRGYITTPEISTYSRMTKIGGVPYVALGEFSDDYGFRYSVDKVSGVVEMRQGPSIVKAMPDSKIVLVNGYTRRFLPETKIQNDQVYIAPSLAEYLKERIFTIKEKEPRKKKTPTIRLIVLDPGHGGKDPGAVRYGVKEKVIVLDIAKRLRNELKDRGGFEIIMTRNNDRFIPLRKRSQIANKAKADLFISIHANAARSRRAKGFEVYFLSSATNDSARAIAAAENEALSFEKKNSSNNSPYLNATVWDMQLNENREESKDLASLICDTSSKGLCVKNRGVKSARFYVLKGTTMPAVLIEVGFVSNREEAKRLNRASYRQKIAEVISDGILAYRRKFDRTEAFTKGVN